MASTSFSVAGSTTHAAHVVAFGATVAFAVTDPTGLIGVRWSILGKSSSAATDLTITTPTTFGASTTIPADPGTDWSWIVKCEGDIGKGYGLGSDGQPDASLVSTRLIGTTTYGAVVPLCAGETTERDAVCGWVGVLNSAMLASYRLIAVRTVTASGTYTPTSGTRAILVECVGGGGAGGSCATGATNSAAGGGGSAGGYSVSWLTGAAIKSSYAVVVGDGGTPAAAGSGAGGNGGNTTFDSPSVCTAIYGHGGEGDTVAAPPRLGGNALDNGNTGVGNLMTMPGTIGQPGMCFAAASAHGGAGAPGPFGGGAYGRTTQGNGYTANQYGDRGSGGSGGCILSGGASVQGGAGAPGLIRVWEFA